MVRSEEKKKKANKKAGATEEDFPGLVTLSSTG